MTAPYRIEKVTPARFEELANAHQDVVIPLEQSPQWAAFEASTGRKPYGTFAYFDGDQLMVIASFLHSTRRLRESIIAVNGPVWFAPRTESAETRFLDTVRQQLRSATDANPVFMRLQVANKLPQVRTALEAGWYDREIVVDLRLDEKAMLASFRPNARQALRKATKAGVTVKLIEHERRGEVFTRELYPILAETSARDDFAAFRSDYYVSLLNELEPYTELMVAYQGTQALSWLITTEYRGYSVYYFAASSAAARSTFAPYLLLWESFKMLKSRGNTDCGLTGIVSDAWPQLANVTTFKRNFSKNEVDLPPTVDVPLKGAQYAALAGVLAARRNAAVGVRTLIGRVKALRSRAK